MDSKYRCLAVKTLLGSQNPCDRSWA